MSHTELVQPLQAQLVFFDLDGTLVEGDSFRYFLSQFRHDARVLLIVGAVGALRKMGIISRSRFFKIATQAARDSTHYEGAVSRTVAWCHDHWRRGVIAHSDTVALGAGVERVLVSASPHDYVGRLDGLLGGRCYGSTLDAEGVSLLFGSAKRDWLVNHFDPKRHSYLAAYSDASDDAPAVNLFEKRFRVMASSGAISEWPAS